MIRYPFKIIKTKGKKYFIESIDLKGCMAESNTKEGAIKNATKALNAYLTVADMRKKQISKPSIIKGKNFIDIKSNITIGFATILRIIREEKKMSQQEMAERLKISQQAYQRYENPNASNLSLKTIEKLEDILSFDIMVITR